MRFTFRARAVGTVLRVAGPVPSRLEVRNPVLASYHVVLRIAGSAGLVLLGSA